MNKEKSAGAVIYCIEGNEIKFLLLKYPTYWGFAKGWIEEGESEEGAAIREIEEETGLRVELIPGFSYKQKWFFRFDGKLIQKEATFFLAWVDRERAKQVRISDEHEDFRWVTLEDSLKIMKVKQNKEMIKSACEFIMKYEKQKKLFSMY